MPIIETVCHSEQPYATSVITDIDFTLRVTQRPYPTLNSWSSSVVNEYKLLFMIHTRFPSKRCGQKLIH